MIKNMNESNPRELWGSLREHCPVQVMVFLDGKSLKASPKVDWENSASLALLGIVQQLIPQLACRTMLFCRPPPAELKA